MRSLCLAVHVALLFLTGCGGGLDPAFTFEHDGLERNYLLHLPPVLKGDAPLPLVVALHGRGGSAEQFSRDDGFNRLADRDGVAVVYPNAIDNEWEDGREKPGPPRDIDDVGFLEALIDHLIITYNLNPARVYMTGSSNGAMMTYRFACERGDRLAAIAPVIGSIPEMVAENCGVASVPALIINGDTDPLVPFDGGHVGVGNEMAGRVLAIYDSAALVADANGCGALVEVGFIDARPLDRTAVRVYDYAGCDGAAQVVLYVIEGGGHHWPGSAGPELAALAGYKTREIDAYALAMDFFTGFARTP